jgi:hypothetical protein
MVTASAATGMYSHGCVSVCGRIIARVLRAGYHISTAAGREGRCKASGAVQRERGHAGPRAKESFPLPIHAALDRTLVN